MKENKKIKIIIIICILLSMILQNIVSIASSLNLGDIKYVQRGDLGFYTIQYWNEQMNQWMYVTYSRTYYTDNNNQKRIAYCTTPDLNGIGWIPGECEGYNTTVKERLSNNKLWRVFKNGYPYVTPAQLGVETDDDAYLATKQAAYFILRNRSESEVYDYFRAGETPINGQDVNEIQRRGKKVVDAIYNLVNIGNNGTDEMKNGITIEKIGDLEVMEKTPSFYSQKYRLKSTGNDSSIQIGNVFGMPSALIVNEKGEVTNNIKSGEIFQVKIPKVDITKDMSITINYTSKSKDYPVYFAKSSIEKTQDYLMMVEKYDEQKGNIQLNINSHTGKLTLLKVDKETNKPIEGTVFNIKYDKGQDLGNFTTTNEGTVDLKNLAPGKLIVTELKSNDNYIMPPNTPIIFDITYNMVLSIPIQNEHKKGNLEIIKVDKDNNNKKLQDCEFDLINNNGDLVKHVKTDENGFASISNINTGEYTLKETKALPGYKLAEDRKVSINYNTTMNIKIENEKIKGKVKVKKVDKENNNIKLANVEFDILDNNKIVVDRIITNENGEAVSKDLPIGKYYIKETKTNEKYILDENLHEIGITENEISELNVENVLKKGKIRIIKTSKNKNNINHLEAGSPIEGVKFGIYDINKKLIQTVITDKQGIGCTNYLMIGKYKIKELETNKWYLIDVKEYEIQIKENEDIATIDIQNDSADPKTEIKKSGPQLAKLNQEIKYNFEIYNSGNTKLTEFTWYDFLPYEYSKITKISTGTYNQKINYNIYYKTNKQNGYLLLKNNLDSKQNNYLDFAEINLEKDEKITQIKFDFGNVDIGFKSEENPYIFAKIENEVENNSSLINETILEGRYNDYKVSSEDKVTTIIENKPIIEKKLPRTGF